MATIGNTGSPSGNYSSYGLNASNAMAIQVTMPQAGLITSISAYFAAWNGHGNTTAYLCIWDSSGNLLARSNGFTITPGTGAQGGQSLQTQNLTSNYQASNGQVLKIGWWRFASGSDEWTETPGGTEYQNPLGGDGNSTSPPNETFHSATGSPQIYATYTPTPSGFVSQVFAYDGANLRPVSTFAYDGSQLRVVQWNAYDGTNLREET